MQSFEVKLLTFLLYAVPNMNTCGKAATIPYSPLVNSFIGYCDRNDFALSYSSLSASTLSPIFFAALTSKCKLYQCLCYKVFF